MRAYSLALKAFEDKIGRKVDSNFKPEGRDELALIHLFEDWKRTFEHLASEADCLPLAITTPSSQMIKRSIVYSSNIAIPLKDKVEDDWWGCYVPESYINLLRNYHDLIRKDLACIVMGVFEKTDSTGLETNTYRFEASKLDCAVVSENNMRFADVNNESLHFKVLLPDVSQVGMADLLALMEDEEIFHDYHNTLNALNLRNKNDLPENKLKEIMLEVDDRTRMLNSSFSQLSKKRTWQAIRSIGGLSLTSFSYFLPPDIGISLRAIFGTLSAVSIADGVLGVAHEKSVLKANPYYFSYLVNKKSKSML